MVFTAHSLPVVAIERGDPYAVLVGECVERVASVLGLAREHLSGAEIVLAEGFKRAPLPKIEVFRPSVAPEPLYDASLPNAAEWAAIVTDDPFYEPACRVVRFQDTMWLQLLAGVTLERAIPIFE